MSEPKKVIVWMFVSLCMSAPPSWSFPLALNAKTLVPQYFREWRFQRIDRVKGNRWSLVLLRHCTEFNRQIESSSKDPLLMVVPASTTSKRLVFISTGSEDCDLPTNGNDSRILVLLCHSVNRNSRTAGSSKGILHRGRYSR